MKNISPEGDTPNFSPEGDTPNLSSEGDTPNFSPEGDTPNFSPEGDTLNAVLIVSECDREISDIFLKIRRKSNIIFLFEAKSVCRLSVIVSF